MIVILHQALNMNPNETPSGDDRDSEADGVEVRVDGGGGGRVRREGHRLLRGPGQGAGHLHRRQHQGTIGSKGLVGDHSHTYDVQTKVLFRA